MKVLFATIMVALCASLQASANNAYLEEQMALLDDGPINKSNKPILASVFRVLTPQGELVSIQEANANVSLTPASTMKLFTGWMALQKGTRSDEYLSQMLHNSDNNKAEQTLKVMGGAATMTSFYRDMGLPMAQLKIIDGSGMSKANRATCNVELELLAHIRQSPDYERYRSMLAAPGEEGTLKDRFKVLQGRFFGKTGTLKTLIALTGYVESSKGTIMFCVISSNAIQSSAGWARERVRIDSIILAKVREIEAKRSF